MTFSLIRIKSCMCEARVLLVPPGVLRSVNFLYIIDTIPMCTLLFDFAIKSSWLSSLSPACSLLIFISRLEEEDDDPYEWTGAFGSSTLSS
jgi:hypothetical protein